MLRRSLLVAAVFGIVSCGDPAGGGADASKGPTNVGGSKPAQDDGKDAEPARAPEDGAAGEDDEGTVGKAEGKAEPGDGDASAAEEGKVVAEAGADEGKADEGKADEGKADEGKADEGKAEEGKADDGEAPPADPKELLKEVKKRKTKDERALEALTQAEEAGAKVRDLAKAANARGLALHATPERAAKFFEWAAEKDAKYPDPLFNLAKQAVNTGDVDKAKELLKKVHERKGKKLLAQLEFDPMWEIVKDDPEVKELYR